MSPPLPRLAAVYHRRPADAGTTDTAGPAWFGTFDLTLDGVDGASFPPGTQLALWCVMGLDPGPATNATVVERNGVRLVIAALDEQPIAAAGRWQIDGLRTTFPARHANDGPESAYLVHRDGTTSEVEIGPVTAAPVAVARHPVASTVGADDSTVDLDEDARPSLVPLPRRLRVDSDNRRRRLAVPDAARPIVDLAGRLGVDVFTDRTAADADVVDVSVRVSDERRPAGWHSLTISGERAELVADDEAGVRFGLLTLAQLAAAGLPAAGEIEDEPAMTFRGVHLDLARRWYEPELVERLIDLAAWRKLSHVHLHLTDDEAWRFPVPEYPALAEVGGTRGHGLPMPPLCGSGAAPYGRAYTAAEIDAWVRRADELGVILVPEVDVPAHCLAALTAVPTLRDPDDTSMARSVQAYVDNVLVPGHPETEPFLRAVFGALAALFPSSPDLHIGGDEVPQGAWRGSPIAQAYAARHGLSTSGEIEAQFHRELIDLIRETTGRGVAMWEEAAFGGVGPGAYAVAWASTDAARRLAESGHRVVVAPGQAYYLDMAYDRAWDTPGTTWAGTVPLETTCDFDPRPLAGDALLGVQACIWSEHIDSPETLDQLAFPRLDAVAERGWRGDVAGGAPSIARRAATLPRFSTPPTR